MLDGNVRHNCIINFENYAQSFELLSKLNVGESVHYDPQTGIFSIPTFLQNIGKRICGENAGATAQAFTDFNQKIVKAIDEINLEVGKFSNEEVSNLLNSIEKIKKIIKPTEDKIELVLIQTEHPDVSTEEFELSKSKLEEGLDQLNQAFELTATEERQAISESIFDFKEQCKTLNFEDIEEISKSQIKNNDRKIHYQEFYHFCSEHQSKFSDIIRNENIPTADLIKTGLAYENIHEIEDFPTELDIDGVFNDDEYWLIKDTYREFVKKVSE